MKTQNSNIIAGEAAGTYDCCFDVPVSKIKFDGKILEFIKKHKLKLDSIIENCGGYGKPSLVFVDGDYKHEGIRIIDKTINKVEKFCYTGKTYTFIYGVSAESDYKISGYRLLQYSNNQVVHDESSNFNNECEYLESKKIDFKPKK